ncbi:tyrosine-type recombinase/integrase [Desulfatirhabdium butyrativorans]|uniref:tyrosine-type recombinase/integrase n=1 Tax=Desulfatirhabdium butyrativorans TaxID=340467 RepID=UPI0003F4E1EE|nr:integrase arm-type DNA-binding domain-containing protein [Desulfatirhabdium butyrativorans]
MGQSTKAENRVTDKLSDVAIRKAKPKEKPYKLSDGKGLRLIVNPNGTKWWRFYYQFGGKEKTLSFGTYPEVTLSEAREKRNVTRKMVANGVDPGVERKEQKVEATNTFEHVARCWVEKAKVVWTPNYAEHVVRRLELNIFPALGELPINHITAQQLLSALKIIESRGAVETAHRMLTLCGQIFRHAIASGFCESNPAANLKGALGPVVKRHYPAITKPNELGELLRAIDGYQGTFVVKCALRIAPLVFVRPGELRKAEWSEIDFEAALWTIPASKMKMRREHLVPLSRQSLAILKELYPFTGTGKYIFPNPRTADRPLSDNAILAALRRMGFDKEIVTGHGFRASARTILDEVLGFRPDYIEHQLAHGVRDPNGRAYNRTAHLVQRTTMMQKWADYLDALKYGAKVFPFPKTGTADE